MNRFNPCILFSSLSGKSSLYEEVLFNAKLFSYDSKVIACDANPNCTAASKVNNFITLPKFDQISEHDILNICDKHKITHILPTSDKELPYWSKNKSFFDENNIIVWVSDLNYINICEDKLFFSKEWVDSEVTTIPTFRQPVQSVTDRWVVKERFGSGSRNISLDVDTKKAQEIGLASTKEMIFQPFIEGREFTAEIWFSRSMQCYGPLLRWRNKVVGGEAHETTIFRNFKWEAMLRSVFSHKPGAYGHINAQVIVDGLGNLNLIEINPRIGGASPLALRGGLHSIAWHLMEDAGQIKEVPFTPKFQNGFSLSKSDGVVSYNIP